MSTKPTSNAAAELGRIGGKSKSDAKVNAARLNIAAALAAKKQKQVDMVTDAIVRGSRGRTTPEVALKMAEEIIAAHGKGVAK